MIDATRANIVIIAFILVFVTQSSWLFPILFPPARIARASLLRQNAWKLIALCMTILALFAVLEPIMNPPTRPPIPTGIRFVNGRMELV